MRSSLLPLLLLFSVSLCYCQTKGKGSVGLEVGFPAGSGSEGVGTGFGGSFRYEGRFKNQNNLNWLASFGYLSFPASGSLLGYSFSGSESIIPITLGVKYYLTESFKGFYFGGELGVSVLNAKVTVTGPGVSASGSGSENKFTFAPSMGYHFGGFDLTFRYNVITDNNYLSIRAAATF
jgi:hypothetical protein